LQIYLPLNFIQISSILSQKQKRYPMSKKDRKPVSGSASSWRFATAKHQESQAQILKATRFTEFGDPLKDFQVGMIVI
jgi:hypothetical protein